MRVCLDASAAVHGRAGLGRYATELAAALPDAGVRDLTLFYNRSRDARVPPPLDRLPRLARPTGDKPWRLATLLAHAAHAPQDRLFPGTDLFHATDNLLPRFGRVAAVFTLYDLIFRFYPATHSRWNRWFLALMMPRFLAAAAAVIAISECTRRDALRLYRVPERKLHVVYPGVSPAFTRPPDGEIAALRQRYGLAAPFALYVGTVEPRKNLPVLFEAFAAARLDGWRLVIAGRSGWLTEATYARAQALGLEQRVLFTGAVPDADLPGLMAAAGCFVYPSLYEGFGLPVLEAMACGAAVIAGDAASLPEVVGDAGILVAPGDVRGWTAALTRLAGDPALRRELAAAGQARAARFTWQAAAAATAEIYREAWAEAQHAHRA